MGVFNFIIFIFMKYEISELRLKQVIFHFLDDKDYIKLQKGSYVFFVLTEDDENCQIRYSISEKECYVGSEISEEISMFFSISNYSAALIIGEWVGKTLNVEVYDVNDMYIRFHVP